MTIPTGKSLLPFAPPPLTLDTVVAYRDANTDLYYERCCLRYMTGKPVPAALREVGPLDPGCAGCGCWILGCREKGIYRDLAHEETPVVTAQQKSQRIAEES